MIPKGLINKLWALTKTFLNVHTFPPIILIFRSGNFRMYINLSFTISFVLYLHFPYMVFLQLIVPKVELRNSKHRWPCWTLTFWSPEIMILFWKCIFFYHFYHKKILCFFNNIKVNKTIILYYAVVSHSFMWV